MGKTKRGKGAKIMAFSDRSSAPLALHAASASPHEVTLVEATLQSAFLKEKPKSQDGRKLRRYKLRWKIERLFAWLQNFRRLVVRYEYKAENFLGMAQLGCVILLLRKCL